MEMSVLETERLLIRPLTSADLPSVPNRGTSEECGEWLRWSELNYRQLARMWQPPYGDRAVVLRATGELVGLVGLVPSLLPTLPKQAGEPFGALHEPQIGMFYEIAQAHRRQGYATEAARQLVAWARDNLHLAQIVGTTEFANTASQATLRKLGMTLLENRSGEPPWLEVVGVLRFDARVLGP
jgi:ribosomal-protein-alanine N-acetyltransferase